MHVAPKTVNLNQNKQVKICRSQKYLYIAVSSPEHLNRFRSVFTLILIMWTVKNDINGDLFNLDRKARGSLDLGLK